MRYPVRHGLARRAPACLCLADQTVPPRTRTRLHAPGAASRFCSRRHPRWPRRASSPPSPPPAAAPPRRPRATGRTGTTPSPPPAVARLAAPACPAVGAPAASSRPTDETLASPPRAAGRKRLPTDTSTPCAAATWHASGHPPRRPARPAAGPPARTAAPRLLSSPRLPHRAPAALAAATAGPGVRATSSGRRAVHRGARASPAPPAAAAAPPPSGRSPSAPPSSVHLLRRRPPPLLSRPATSTSPGTARSDLVAVR
nr:atherin-like [Aegilops tauschii subsp. strangulata]